MSLVSSVAASASVREMRTVGTPSTSAARRAAFSVPTNCAGRDEHLPAEVTALLLRRELVLEVDACGAGLDHPLHQLERVEVAAEAGLGVGDDRHEPVARDLTLRLLDLVGALSARFRRRTSAGTLFAG